MIGTKDLALGTLAAVTAEAQRMGDVVFLPNVNEAYGLLTAKVLEAFIWVNTHRPHAEAVLKVRKGWAGDDGR